MAIRKSTLRRVINEEIRRILEEGVDDPGILKCIFLAGGPGSGKSYTAKEIFGITHKLKKQTFSAGGLKIVSSDMQFEKGLKDAGINPKDLGKIERENPELWIAIAGDDNPKSIRAHAKGLTNKLKSLYSKGRLGMIIDGTGEIYGKIQKKKQQAEAAGYDCYMIFVNTSLDVAIERNRNRDRSLSDEKVKEIWEEVQHNLGAFQRLFGHNFSIVDNTERRPPDKEVVKTLNKFMREPIKNPIGKKWIETQRKLKKAKAI